MDSKDINSSRGFTKTAMKVNKVRGLKAGFNSKIGYYAAIAFFGLAAGGSSLAFIPAGVAAVTIANTTYNMERNVIKSNAIKHKLKKIAKKVKRACGINIRPEYNYNTRQAGFILCDNMSGKIPVTSFLTSDNISDYLSSEQIATINEIIDSEFAIMNSYRGLGDDAQTIKEYRYREFDQIGLDNITSAFDDVGGVLTDRELMSLSRGSQISRIEYKQFMREHKGESLWVFSGHLSDYLNSLTALNTQEKNSILNEFKHYFSKQGEEGEYEFQKLSEQINEENEMKRAM